MNKPNQTASGSATVAPIAAESVAAAAGSVPPRLADLSETGLLLFGALFDASLPSNIDGDPVQVRADRGGRADPDHRPRRVVRPYVQDIFG